MDFVFGRIYNLIKAESRECRSCTPPVPGYRNETFHELENVVDMFFGPYKDTSALYIVSRTETPKTIQRIRFTGSTNRSPVAKVTVSATSASVGQVITFDGSASYDPDGDSLTYRWNVGDSINTSSSTAKKTEHVYTSRGVFNVKFTVTDTKGQVDQSFVSISVGKPPTAQMSSPAAGKTFTVGEVIRLMGSAVESSGKALPSSQLFWEVRQHHESHWHPFLDRRSGNNFNLFPAPKPEDFLAATNSYLNVIMYAVDSDGLTTVIQRKIMPSTRRVSVSSVPSGLKVLVDGYPGVTPKTIATWANNRLWLDVDDQSPYVFKAWSDGGARRHAIKISVSTTSIRSVQVTFAVGSSAPRLVVPVRDCSSQRPCGRCEGHCQNDAECQSPFVCYDKGGRNRTVRGCTGIDGSHTKWCTIA
jgi:PKD repeat protein